MPIQSLLLLIYHPILLQFQPHGEKRAQTKQKGAMGAKSQAASSVYVIKLPNSHKKENIIVWSNVRSPIIPTGNPSLFVYISPFSVAICNHATDSVVPFRKCYKTCVDHYNRLQQQVNCEKKSMNVCFQIIPEDSYHEVSHPQGPLDEPHTVQVKIKSAKIKRVNKAQTKRDRAKRNGKNHWRAQENARYVHFIKNNIEFCKMTRYQKIKSKFNVRMSKVVKTKDPAQCRSHNQKMMIKYGTPEEIVKALGKNFSLSKKVEGFEARIEQMSADQVDSAKDRQIQDIFEVVGLQKRVDQRN